MPGTSGPAEIVGQEIRKNSEQKRGRIRLVPISRGAIGGNGDHGLLFSRFMIGGKWKASIQLAARQRTNNKMKRAFFLCAAISAAIILVGCANQNSSATTSRTSGFGEQGAVSSGTGSGGGLSGRDTTRTLP